MKFGFLENRYKTAFWQALAEEIESCGHEVVWLVQNPEFRPTSGKTFVIPFPSKRDLVSPSDQAKFSDIEVSDRYINYFGGNNRHYEYYLKSIDNWLSNEQPQIVLGESTLFHELLAINLCKNRDVPFFHPSMPGYPGGRYSIYLYDTKKTVGESSVWVSDAECLEVLDAITKRKRIPDYMIPPSGEETNRSYPMPRSLKDRWIILKSYIKGERYNTPSPWMKLRLDRAVKKRIKIWMKVNDSKKHSNFGKKCLLYPLQMQPEANLDVWGKRYRNQAALIKNLADSLPADWYLSVKLNPKCKYELNDEIISIIHDHPKIYPLHVDSSMVAAFSRADLVCTVTGTVAVECVLAGKALVQFGPGIVEGRGCLQISDPTKIRDAVSRVDKGQFDYAEREDKIDLVRRLYNTTFPGKVSDPATNPAVMNKNNVKSVAKQILRLASKLEHQKPKDVIET